MLCKKSTQALLSVFLTAGLLSSVVTAQVTLTPAYTKERIVILTDIEADPDDTQSLVRLLLYANQIDLVGLVATTSCWHRTRVDPGAIEKVVKAYGQVRDNLALHEDGFPKESDIQALIKSGKPLYGMSGVGERMDSEGSELIIQQLEAIHERPVGLRMGWCKYVGTGVA